MRPFITSFIAVAGLVGAVSERQAAAVGFTDTYDALSTGSSIGLLHAIQYTGASVEVGHLANGTRSIVPHSTPKFAQGTKPLAQVQFNGQTVDTYIRLEAGQNVSSFDVYNFYFACVAVGETGYGAAQPCTVAVVGSGPQQSTATFQYEPSTPNEAAFGEAQFYYPDFREMGSMDIGIVRGSAPEGKTALAVDSLYHLNYASG